MAELTEKAIKKAIKRRFDYMKAHRHELTLKQARRLLEDDLKLPEKALDEEPHKSLIKHQVDEIMRLLVVLEAEAEGRVAAPASQPANLKRARDDATKSQANELPKLGSSAHACALKAVLKRATIPIAPALYKAAAGDEAAFCSALERTLAHEGLRVDSSDKEVAAVQQRRELARDLDGIDVKNVVEAEHGRPRRAAAAMAPDTGYRHGTCSGAQAAAGDERAASSPPGRRRVLRVDEWEDDDA